MITKALLILYYLFASTSGLILIKIFFNENRISFHSVVSDYRILLGALLYLTSFLAWLFILAKDDLSYIYPVIVGLSYIAILIASFVILKEHIDIYRIVGIFFIFVGILLVSIKG